MSKKSLFKILTIFVITICLAPTIVLAESSDNQSGSGGQTTGDGSGKKTNWPNYVGSAGVAGIRMTVVDQWGNLVPGTHTVDFVNVIPTDAAANARGDRMKTGAIRNGMAWVSLPASGISIEKSYVDITWNSNDNLIVNGVSQATYFNGLAKSDELYNNYIVKTGYNRSMQVNYKKHYILVEPTTVLQLNGKRYYGTATELALIVGNGYTFVNKIPRVNLAVSTCYSGSFMTPGPKNNGQTIANGDQLYAFTGGSLTGNSCNKLSKNADITRISGNTVNGNGVGIYYAASMLKEWCDINNPEHFHVVDGSDDQDYKPNDKTALCCEEMIAQYGEEYVTKLYPICGACPVTVDSNKFPCGSEESVTLKDTSSFDCLYKGVSGVGANKYDYSSRESVRKKYKVGTIGTKYCEVYCTDEVSAKFPGNYTGMIAPGGTFIWPSYNNDYNATIDTKRTCKIRFRQQEWLSAFNNGDANTKQNLVDALKECSAESSLTKFYDKYINSLDPKLELSYNNGIATIGPKTLKLSTNESTSSMTCDNCSMDTSSFNVGNVTSLINNIASQITNKVLNIKAKLKYVLPDGLYQYVDKKSGTLIQNYNPSDEDKDSDGKLDTGYSKLLVSEEAKVGNKYDLTIDYSHLSPVSGKFDKESGKYVCNYEVTANSSGLKCDFNEKNHFLDLNGDGKLDSGPNGEDCCEKAANEFGKDSEIYKDLVNKGWCPATPPTDNTCEYPADLTTTDIVTKQKCCSMVLTDPDLPKAEREEYYKQYCTGDPYCPQDCVDGVCHDSPMTQDLRNCMATGKSYNECKIDNCPGGGSIVIYRPISLLANEAFPGVEKLNRIWSNNNWYYYSNWAYRGSTSQDRDYYVDKYITNNRGVKEYEIYNMEPMYTIELNAETINEIRKYNKTHSYDDFTLECKNDRKCRSDWVKKYAEGCGVSDDWYACEGISASRGD